MLIHQMSNESTNRLYGSLVGPPSGFTLPIVKLSRCQTTKSSSVTPPQRIQREEIDESIWLNVDSYDLMQGISDLASRLHEEFGIRELRFGLEAAGALAHRVLADRDAPERGDQVRSVVDPEARRGKQGSSVAGYRLEISVDADSELLGAVEVLAGNGDEARDALRVVCAP